jgi:serine/threonine protein phosphatase PrpC
LTPTLPLTAAHASTRTGPRHVNNEDQFRILDGGHPLVATLRRGALYAVCDGVSSTPRGREAAELGAARIEDFFNPQTPPRLETLVQLVSEVDWELREGRKGEAACTFSALWLAHGRAHVVHVGDSQVFRVRHGQCERLTQVQKGRSALNAFLGMGPKVADVLQVWEEPLYVGDLFLLLTDGVTEVMQPDELLDAWWAVGGATSRAAHAIVSEVDRRGSTDDATVLVVDVLAVEQTTPATTLPPGD